MGNLLKGIFLMCGVTCRSNQSFILVLHLTILLTEAEYHLKNYVDQQSADSLVGELFFTFPESK